MSVLDMEIDKAIYKKFSVKSGGTPLLKNKITNSFSETSSETEIFTFIPKLFGELNILCVAGGFVLSDNKGYSISLYKGDTLLISNQNSSLQHTFFVDPRQKYSVKVTSNNASMYLDITISGSIVDDDSRYLICS